jgi:type III secretion protein U
MSDEKTEQPTAKRLRDEHKKGNVPHSKDATSALLVWAGCTYLLMSSPRILSRLLALVDNVAISAYKPFRQVAYMLLEEAETIFVETIVPWVGILVGASVLGGFLLSGPVLATEKLKLDFEKLDIVANLKNIFSANTLIEAIKSLLKVSILGAIVAYLVATNIQELVYIAGAGIHPLVIAVGVLLRALLTTTALTFTAIAAVDVLMQFKLHRRRLKMSKDEVKRESKESEGDPEIKGERRRLHQEIVDGGGMSVSQASAVVTNPTHLAVAIRYVQDETPVPQVIAKGAGLVARAIVEEARAAGVPIIEHVPLARALTAQVEVKGYVPLELFEMVIDVLKAVEALAPASASVNPAQP